MALKIPLKLKQQPKRVAVSLPKVTILNAAAPRAPTGNVERWLVTHKQTGGVLSVVWDHYWFGARARAEWVHKIPRDELSLRHMPLMDVEKGAPHPMSGLQLAKAIGMKMHTEVEVGT